MTTKKKCAVCGKRFEAKRSDTLYCSAQCKQHAHYKRSATKETDTPQEVFYMDEYNEVEKVQKEMELITYCFLRRNLNADATVEEILRYIQSVWDYGQLWENFWETKPFIEYRNRFLNGEVKIFSKRPQPQ
ncbi:hypothetical protein DR864_12865 [Runella rosea]|uniref:Uncharacterized protein n=1 Tax=Runella rosea TaxID=2259595 RepID=A0A344TIW3_9BACT|nr:hypothetical protein [Runella rosea]AXE18584.1 hypothetical protein DR864_12865 [Runella rosea]